MITPGEILIDVRSESKAMLASTIKLADLDKEIKLKKGPPLPGTSLQDSRQAGRASNLRNLPTV